MKIKANLRPNRFDTSINNYLDYINSKAIHCQFYQQHIGLLIGKFTRAQILAR